MARGEERAIDLAELLVRRGNDAADGVFVRDVELEGDPVELGRDRLGSLAVEVGDGDAAALRREAPGHGRREP